MRAALSEAVDLALLPKSARSRVAVVDGCFVWPENKRSPIPTGLTWNGGLVGGVMAVCGTDRCVRASHLKFVWRVATDKETREREKALPEGLDIEIEAPCLPEGALLAAAEPTPAAREKTRAPTEQTPPARKDRPSKRDATHCARGHEMTPENVYVMPKGTHRCRTCQRERVKAYRARNPKPPQPEIVACPHGHEYTPENSYTDAKGSRRCRTCRREQRRRGAERARLGDALPLMAAAIVMLARGEAVTEETIQRLQEVAESAGAPMLRPESEASRVVSLPAQADSRRTA